MVVTFQPKAMGRALEERREAIGLTKKRLAELSRLDEGTVARVLRGSGGLVETYGAVADAISREENRLRKHLAKQEGESAHA